MKRELGYQSRSSPRRSTSCQVRVWGQISSIWTGSANWPQKFNLEHFFSFESSLTRVASPNEPLASIFDPFTPFFCSSLVNAAGRQQESIYNNNSTLETFPSHPVRCIMASLWEPPYLLNCHLQGCLIESIKKSTRFIAFISCYKQLPSLSFSIFLLISCSFLSRISHRWVQGNNSEQHAHWVCPTSTSSFPSQGNSAPFKRIHRGRGDSSSKKQTKKKTPPP